MRLTWTLWHALNHPPTLHPLFWLTRRRLPSSAMGNLQLNWAEKVALIYLLVLALLLMISSTRVFVIHPALLGVLVGLLTLPIIVLVLGLLQVTVFSGTYHGLNWATQISRLILHERANHTFELLCLLPAGALAGIWAIATGYLYQCSQFNRALQTRILILRVIGLLAALYLAPVLLRDPYVFTVVVVPVGCFIFALYLDFVHSAILAIQIAILTALHTDNLLDARLWSVGGFLTGQVLTYTLTLMLASVILPRLLLPLALPDWLTVSLNSLLTLAAFHILRAGLIRLLWWGLLRELNTHLRDMGEVFAPGQPQLSGIRPVSRGTV